MGFFKKLWKKIQNFLVSPTVKKLESITIASLAKDAATFAEKELVGATVDAKEQVALNYLLSKIPVPLYLVPFKAVIIGQLEDVINNAISEAISALQKEATPVDSSQA